MWPNISHILAVITHLAGCEFGAETFTTGSGVQDSRNSTSNRLLGLVGVTLGQHHGVHDHLFGGAGESG